MNAKLMRGAVAATLSLAFAFGSAFAAPLSAPAPQVPAPQVQTMTPVHYAGKCHRHYVCVRKGYKRICSWVSYECH